MRAEDWTIYVACTPSSPLKYTSAATLKPMIGHSTSLSEEERQKFADAGYLFDSRLSDLNPWWAELTCIDHVVHHATEPFLGIAQYRRPWNEDALAPSKEHVLYVTESAYYADGIAAQCRAGHKAFDAIALTIEAARDTSSYPFTEQDLETLWAQPYLHGCSMARGPAPAFKRAMTILLEAVEPIWERNKEQLMAIEGYDRRSIAFIAERLMTGIILYRDKLLPGIEVMTAPIGYVP
jgi:hypothetical protein